MPLYKSKYKQFVERGNQKQLARPPVPPPVIYHYDPIRKQPWKPTQGMQGLQDKPALIIYDREVLKDYSSRPAVMVSEPITFPNLVTGYNRNTAQIAKTAFNAVYSPEDKKNGIKRLLHSADISKSVSDGLKTELMNSMRYAEERCVMGQMESGRRIGERITDINFWRNEVNAELDRLIIESDKMQDQRKFVIKCMDDIEAAIHMVQETLFQREQRKGMERVNDEAQQSLMHEVELYRNKLEAHKKLLLKIQDQVQDNRLAQNDLEIDVGSKDSALAIDKMCHKLNNYSRGLKYYGGIEDGEPPIFNTVTWAENSCHAVQRSQMERKKSSDLRLKIKNDIQQCASEVQDAWNNTTGALERIITETYDHKRKILSRLEKIKLEVFRMDKYIQMLRRAIEDKNNPLKMAHTRLEARMHRKNIELVQDKAEDRLIYEVKDLQSTMRMLDMNLQRADNHRNQLNVARLNLQEELYNKVHALSIDDDKCMTMRRGFPINAVMKYD